MDVSQERHVAAMRAVKSASAVEVRREIESQVSRCEDSAVLVVPPRPYATSVASGDLDSDERCAIEPSRFPCQHLLLVEWLVQLFVADTRFVPQIAQRLLAPSDLPPALERVAIQAQGRLQTWFAWAQESRVWFLVADMGTDLGEYYQGAAVRMFFYDEDGRFVSSGTWALQSKRSWSLCER